MKRNLFTLVMLVLAGLMMACAGSGAGNAGNAGNKPANAAIKPPTAVAPASNIAGNDADLKKLRENTNGQDKSKTANVPKRPVNPQAAAVAEE